MNTYEAAPATHLLATHCAVCNRALRDATSVERGVGPDCAEKYGYADASQACDESAVMVAIVKLCAVNVQVAELVAGVGENPASVGEAGTIDAKGVASRAVHHIAALAHGMNDDEKRAEAVELLIEIIRAAGYARMANACSVRIEAFVEERAARIAEERATAAQSAAKAPTLVVTETGERLALTFKNLSPDQFNALIGILRSIPSRRYDPATKSNTVLAFHKRTLWTALTTRECFAGMWVESAKGRVQLAA
jgi:hypothetical protein